MMSDHSSGLEAPTLVRSLKEGPAKESASGEMSEATFRSAAAMRWGRCESAAISRSCFLRVDGGRDSAQLPDEPATSR